MGILVAFTAVAFLTLLCRQTLFLAFHLALFAMQGGIKHILARSVAPAKHQSLVAQNALLMHMRKDFAYLLHTHAGFGKVGVICNQYGRKPTLLVILIVAQSNASLKSIV